VADTDSELADGPLVGTRVLEFTQIVAGPVAGMSLADLGADVIKVEPATGDPHRFVNTSVPGESKMYQGNNRGKRGLVIDLQDPRGQDALQRLVPTIDIVLVNYRAGVAERLGIDYDTLRAIRPNLIYAQLSGFGEGGPSASRGGSDIVAQAHSGLMALDAKSDEHGTPQLIGTPLSDYTAGLSLAMGICAALLHRERTGEGQYVSTSLLRAGLLLQNRHVMREPVSDAAIRDPRMAALHEAQASGAPFPELADIRQGRGQVASPFQLYYRAYQAADGFVIIGALTPLNRAAIRSVFAIEDREHSDDPDFDAHDPANIETTNHWREWLEAEFRTQPVDHWLTSFEAVGVPAARLNFPEEMADDDQANADGMIVELEHTVTGPQRVVGPPVLMSRTPTGSRLAAPAFGEHTRHVLAEAGLAAEEIDALIAAGIARTLD